MIDSFFTRSTVVSVLVEQVRKHNFEKNVFTVLYPILNFFLILDILKIFENSGLSFTKIQCASSCVQITFQNC